MNVDVSGAFVDPDGDALSFTASSSAPQVVTASVTGAFVMLVAARKGAATIRGDGDRPRWPERGAVVHGHGGGVGIRALHR